MKTKFFIPVFLFALLLIGNVAYGQKGCINNKTATSDPAEFRVELRGGTALSFLTDTAGFFHVASLNKEGNAYGPYTKLKTGWEELFCPIAVAKSITSPQEEVLLIFINGGGEILQAGYSPTKNEVTYISGY